MPVHRAQVEVPYTPLQMFDLVADIERYSLFLPQIVSARITARRGDTLWVEQIVRFKMFKLPFRTRATLRRPVDIHIICDTSPLLRFTEDWTFTATERGTQLASVTNFELISGLLNRALSVSFSELQATTLRAFAARAKQLHGTGTS